MEPENYDIDLGDDNHYLQFTSWKPDRELNPQYAHLPDLDKAGALIYHRRIQGGDCCGAIMFDSEVARQIFGERSLWTVESWEPLTISPSIKCSCGDHGFITNNKWVKA